MVIFETQRLIAREWEPEKDAQRAFEIYSHPEVMHFIKGPSGIPTNVEEQKARLELRCAEYRKYEGTGSWALEEKETGTIVGSVILKWLPDADRVPTGDLEVGWHLAREHWGKGYASESGLRAVQYAFDNLQPPVIYAVVRLGNERSVRVTQRMGMQPIGRTDKYYGVELLLFALKRFAHQTQTAEMLKGAAG